MKYLKPKGNVKIVGVGLQSNAALVPWQSSTWPQATRCDARFLAVVGRIFRETIMGEIRNVIGDAMKTNGSLEQRGHVIAIALLCAVDALSSYGYGKGVGRRFKAFITNHFPPEYRPYAGDLYSLYRNSMVHSWNLFEVAIVPGSQPITKASGSLLFGLLHFFDALEQAVNDFLVRLKTDPAFT
jgi:hypothetical protein